MVNSGILTMLVSLLALASTSVAHPGETDHTHEVLERRAQLAAMPKRDLNHCAAKLAARGVHARNAVRRRALLENTKRHYKRDTVSVLATSHKSNLTGITASTNASTLFTGSNQCILGPDVTQGPYYVTGELFRQNVTDGQAGIPMIIDVQIIDTTTCEPLPNVAIDFWHCNATGVYSGVVSNGNGDSSDASNINATFMRGIQSTDADGVLQFMSVVPGHYSGRAPHVHILAHTEGNWEKLANNTISGGTTAAHVGQVFFDQDLITEVGKVEPYASNSQKLTLNADDSLMAEESAIIDPVVEYVLLGDTVADGIFAWISMGIASNASATVQPAVIYGAGGGVENPNGGRGGGGPGGSPGGSGGPPGSASATTGADGATTSAPSSAAAPGTPVSLLLAFIAIALPLAQLRGDMRANA